MPPETNPFNRTMQNLSSLLHDQAKRYGNKPFVEFERQENGPDILRYRQSLSYLEFDRRVDSAAGWLRSQGVKHGEVINLHLPNSVSFLVLWFACARSGITMMPTNVLSSAEEMHYLLDHSGSVLVVTTREFLPVMELATKNTAVRDLIISDPFTDEPCDSSFEYALRSDAIGVAQTAGVEHNLVSIMYTSGTTSRPKGVMVTHANYIAAGRTVADAIGLTHRDRQYAVLPLFHGNAQYYSTMSALLQGATLVLMDRFSASRFMAKAAEYQCTVASLFAAPIRMILAQPESADEQRNVLRVTLYAQSITKQQGDQWAHRFGAPLCQLWGMTETMGPPLMNPPGGDIRNESIGLPVGGYPIRLVDEQGEDVECGDIGEILVGGVPGETLMLGYFKNPEATAQTLSDGWLRTGDNGRLIDGYYYFVDRLKDMIKRSGENVAATEVESVVNQHPAVYESAVVGVPDAMKDEEVVAVVVRKSDFEVSEEEIVQFCSQRLASFRVPGRVEFVDSMPRTSVGKIQKHRIREMLQAGE
ncbi:MAG: AMP-binding protein [Pseudomonadota bacterium]